MGQYKTICVGVKTSVIKKQVFTKQVFSLIKRNTTEQLLNNYKIPYLQVQANIEAKHTD